MGMGLLNGIIVSIALMAGPNVVDNGFGGIPARDLVSKLRGGLSVVLANAGEGELIPVTIAMRDQVPRAQIVLASQIGERDARHEAVKGLLKSLADSSQKELLALLRVQQRQGHVGDRIEALWLANVVSARLTADVAYRVAARDDVAYLNHDRPMGHEVLPVEPGDSGGVTAGAITCGVELMGAPRVWNELGFTGRGVVVAVIDSGVCITHPDLTNQIWVNQGEVPDNGIDDDNNGFIDDVHGWNFQHNNNDIADKFTNGHGTHVAGTVAGDGTSGTTTGLAPDCELMIVKYLSAWSGESTVWQSMQYAVDNRAHLITASLGWPHDRNPDRATWRRLCENAIAAGLVVIYGAGNEGTCCPPFDHIRTPGDVPAVITVGGTDCNDVVWDRSSRGPVTWQDVPPYNDWPYPPGKIKPTIAAPAVDTISTSNRGWSGEGCEGYRTLSGTSMSTPHVAGAVALMLEANPNLTHEEVKDILMSTAIDLGEPGMDNESGAGRVDAFAAVKESRRLAGDKGDLNCDGSVDLTDVGPFITALTDPDEYKRQFPDCDINNGDLNADGSVNLTDVEPFIELLLGP